MNFAGNLYLVILTLFAKPHGEFPVAQDPELIFAEILRSFTLPRIKKQR
jgi:hypothetical protein